MTLMSVTRNDSVIMYCNSHSSHQIDSIRQPWIHREISFPHILPIHAPVIHHSLIISQWTIRGSLWFSQTQIQWLVDDALDIAFIWGGFRLKPPLSYWTPDALSHCLSSLHALISSSLPYLSFTPHPSLPPSSLCPLPQHVFSCFLVQLSLILKVNYSPRSSPYNVFSFICHISSFPPSSHRDYSPGFSSLKRCIVHTCKESSR